MLPDHVEIVFFEDAQTARFNPLTLNRPIWDLVVGARSNRQRFEQITRRKVTAADVRPHLTPLLADAALAEARTGASERPRLWVNGSLLVGSAEWAALQALPEGTALMDREHRIAALHAPAGHAFAIDEEAPCAAGFTTVTAPIRMLSFPWDLMGRQEELLREDVSAFDGAGGIAGGADCHLLGERAFADEGVQFDGPVVLDSRKGPIHLRTGARIGPFSVLEGPLVIERYAQILGGRIAGSYIGPHARIRGELEATTVLGWSNKAHTGFVGHSYLGCWVNLGALTTTSDLKNNYGIVQMHMQGALQPTGLIKVGSLIADHAKTAIGTLLGGGTTVGLGANLFGDRPNARKLVPAFAWGMDATYDLELFLQTARVVCARRGVELRDADVAVLRAAFEQTAAERAAGESEACQS